MSFQQIAEARYSLRKFDGRPVDEKTMGKILDAIRVAPSAKNLQPVRIYLIQSDEALEKINSVCPCIYGSKTVLLACYDSSTAWSNPFHPEIRSGQIDASIVLSHAMLAAKELGVDSCWVCRFDNSEVERVMGLPENIKTVSIMPLGYPAEGAGPSERHTVRKPLDEWVTRM